MEKPLKQNILLFVCFLGCHAFFPPVKAEVLTRLQQPIRPPNPIKRTPSAPIEWIPGLTERDMVIIAVASDLNQGSFAVFNYNKCQNFEESLKGWEDILARATKQPEGSLYKDYLRLRETRAKKSQEELFFRKIEKAISRMLNHPKNFHGFYNLKKLFLLKNHLIKTLNVLLRKDKKSQEAWMPVLQKHSNNIVNYENTLLEFGFLDDNSIWDTRKKIAAHATLPLTKTTELLSKAYTATSPLDNQNKRIASQLFLDYLNQKYEALVQKVSTTFLMIKKNQEPVAWSTTTSYDPETFSNPRGTLIPLLPENTKKHRLSKTVLHPFGTVPSSPSPIPGLSWRRLAEIFSSQTQTFHAKDFSFVVDWRSFFTCMMNDPETSTYQQSLFAKFLKVYAPETFFNVFSLTDDADMLTRTSIAKEHFDLIVGIIGILKKPHKAHVKYTYRTALAKVEARLLHKLLEQYENKAKNGITKFPGVTFTLKDRRRPLRTKFAPDNLELRFNTENPELYKAVVMLNKLNYLEIASDSINKHSTWSKASTIAKTPVFIATAPLTAVAHAIETTTPTAEARKSQTVQAVLRKRISLLKKFNEICERLKKTSLNQTYSKFISLAKTTYAESETSSLKPADQATPLQPSSTPHAKEIPMIDMEPEASSPRDLAVSMEVRADHELYESFLPAAKTASGYDI